MRTRRATQSLGPVLTGVALLTGLLGAAAGTGDLHFRGSMVAVTDVTITIRQDDGILINALLPDARGLTGKELAAKYQIGDLVEIAAHTLSPPAYDAIANKRRWLALDSLYYRGKPSQQALIATLQSRALLTPHNLLVRTADPSSPGVGAAGLAQEEGQAGGMPVPSDDARVKELREHILDYVAHMPNYTADEVATRFQYFFQGELLPPNPVPWHLLDRVEDQVTVDDGRESRDHVLLNGRQWQKPWVLLPGSHWNSAFAVELRETASNSCLTMLTPAGSVQQQGETLLIYSLSSPRDGCLGGYNSGYEGYFAPSTGRVFTRERDGSIARMELQVSGFPPEYPIRSIANAINWGSVTVEGQTYNMPVSAEQITALGDGRMSRVQLQFLHYRHFAASHVIHYGDASCCTP